MSLIDSIKGCPLFYELYDDEIEDILSSCVVKTFNKGELVMQEGGEGQEFYVVLNGQAEVTKVVNGKKVSINTLRRGDVFGETVLINETKRLTSVEAVDRCDVLVIEHDTIFSTFEKKTKVFAMLILNLARMLTFRLRASNSAISKVHERLDKIA